MRAPRLLLAAAALALGGCELSEVTTTGGADLLVVESVLRAGAERQVVLLHRTLDGRTVAGEPGARVAIRGPAGEVELREQPLGICTEEVFPDRTDTLEIAASCYAAPADAGLEVRPGATYELRVETTRGEMARGRTTVPGLFRLRTPALAPGERVCELEPLTNLELAWTPADSAWAYLVAMDIVGLREALRPAGIDAPMRLQLTGVSISRTDTTLIVPAEIGVFDRFDQDQELLRLLQAGFPAGVAVETAVLAVDRNYVNAVRGGSFNPSGSVRISTVVGDAVGVFGSAAVATVTLVVGRGTGFPPCRG